MAGVDRQRRRHRLWPVSQRNVGGSAPLTVYTDIYHHAGLTCGTSYTLAVDAVDAAGNRSGKASLTTSTAACPSAPPPPPPSGAASVFVSSSGSDANACSQAGPCKTFDRAYRVAGCGAVVEIAGGSYPDQSINAPEKECSAYVTFRPATGAVVTAQTVTIRSGDWIKFLGTGTNFLMRDNGSQGDTSGFYISPTGTGMNEPVDHIWVEGLDFETFLLRGSDDVTFKNNDIGPGKSNHFDEKLWVSVGHDGSNYVNNYSTNLVLDGNRIHGFTRDACVASGCHVECLTMRSRELHHPQQPVPRLRHLRDHPRAGRRVLDQGQQPDRGQRHPVLQNHERIRGRVGRHGVRERVDDPPQRHPRVNHNRPGRTTPRHDQNLRELRLHLALNRLESHLLRENTARWP